MFALATQHSQNISTQGSMNDENSDVTVNNIVSFVGMRIRFLFSKKYCRGRRRAKTIFSSGLNNIQG